MKLSKFKILSEELNLQQIEDQILEIKKELIKYHIKKNTKQDIKPHIIKKLKHKLSQLLTLETLKTQ
uniref:Ribosomal protein L29 n=1 Tax=Wrangelia sp. TaxID=2575620 RepID=A0A4D6WZ07_9FLOR|nr:ribosomal protein L29 [Wrangelia sp.]